ncbi:hypothetical protein PA598K_04043, partial [Paenibacillus sp. 598K]|uniref:hypothetical protein n=1 Tax=Paenibacillus sp. 598K TaxID=1117987 RepID=UPI000FF98ABE
ALAAAALDSGFRAEIWEVADAHQAGHSDRPDRADRADRADAEMLAYGTHIKRWVIGETGLRLDDDWGGGVRDAVIS